MSEVIGQWLCRVGWHRWKYVGSSLFGDPAYLCMRPYCRKGKQDFLAGATVYWDRTETLEGDK